MPVFASRKGSIWMHHTPMCLTICWSEPGHCSNTLKKALIVLRTSSGSADRTDTTGDWDGRGTAEEDAGAAKKDDEEEEEEEEEESAAHGTMK